MSVVAAGRHVGRGEVGRRRFFCSCRLTEPNMEDAMKRSLRVLGTTALMSCLPCASFAAGPTTSSTPPTMSAISYKMGGVAGDLAKKETGEPVQNQEKRIVRDLDE